MLLKLCCQEGGPPTAQKLASAASSRSASIWIIPETFHDRIQRSGRHRSVGESPAATWVFCLQLGIRQPFSRKVKAP